MTRKDEDYLFDAIEQIKEEVHRNNRMLSEICGVINVYLANHHQENEADFGRNVLANLISNILDIGQLKRR